MYHSITILDKKNNQRVFQNGNSNIINWLNQDVINFVKDKFNIGKKENIMVVSAFTETNIDYIVNYLKKKSYNKIYIFIEDVFRLTNIHENNFLETWFLEKYPNETVCYELETVKKIINSLPNTSFKIFHCEDNTILLEEIYNLKINYFDWFLSTQCLKEHYHKIDTNFKYKICSFNLRPQENRFLIGILLKNKLDTYVTLNNYLTENELLSLNSFNFYNFSIDVQNEILKSHKKIKPKNFKTLPPEVQNLTLSKTKESFLQVVSETRYSSPMPNFTEKTLKSMWAFRPFILMAPPKTLQLLKSLGFKTFSNYWDESYDLETDHQKRFEQIYQLSKEILKKDVLELKSILNSMSPILIHNFHHIKKLKESMYNYSNLQNL